MSSTLPLELFLLILEILFVERDRASLVRFSCASRNFWLCSLKYVFHCLFVRIDVPFFARRLAKTFDGTNHLDRVQHVTFMGSWLMNDMVMAVRLVGRSSRNQMVDWRTTAAVLEQLPAIQTVELRRLIWCAAENTVEPAGVQPSDANHEFNRAFASVRGLSLRNVGMFGGSQVAEEVSLCFPDVHDAWIESGLLALPLRFSIVANSLDTSRTGSTSSSSWSKAVLGWVAGDNIAPEIGRVHISTSTIATGVLRRRLLSIQATVRVLSIEVDLIPKGRSSHFVNDLSGS